MCLIEPILTPEELRFEIKLIRYEIEFGRKCPIIELTGMRCIIDRDEFIRRIEGALARKRPLRGWWDDGSEQGDADARVPPGEPEFNAPLTKEQIREAKRRMRRKARELKWELRIRKDPVRMRWRELHHAELEKFCCLDEECPVLPP